MVTGMVIIGMVMIRVVIIGMVVIGMVMIRMVVIGMAVTPVMWMWMRGKRRVGRLLGRYSKAQ